MNQMFRFLIILVLYLPMSLLAASNHDHLLCSNLKDFVLSVPHNTKNEVVLRTSWGSGFKEDEEKDILFAKTCDHQELEHAKSLCDYLIDNTSAEFPYFIFKRMVSCASPKTKLDPKLKIHTAFVGASYPSDDPDEIIDIELSLEKNADDNEYKIRVVVENFQFVDD